MKIKGHVLAVSNNGDQIEVKMQGATPGAARWRRLEVVTFTLPDTDGVRRTFFIGRKLTITIKASA